MKRVINLSLSGIESLKFIIVVTFHIQFFDLFALVEEEDAWGLLLL